MKLSNTLMINESLLPSNKKAFTLAEVLITLSILGVVAALTIPSLVNRQSDLAAQVKIKKAIANYEQVAAVYMAENEASSFANALNTTCSNAANYFKIVTQSGCTFTTADGAEWTIEPGTGFAYVQDNVDSKTPRYGVTMYALNGQVNGTGSTDGTGNYPKTLFVPKSTPLHGVYVAYGEYSFNNFKSGSTKKAYAKGGKSGQNGNSEASSGDPIGTGYAAAD